MFIQIFLSCVCKYLSIGSHKEVLVCTLAWQWWHVALQRFDQVAAAEPLECSHGRASYIEVAVCSHLPLTTLLQFSLTLIWLCGLGRILMDSLICSLFWGARISGIIAFAVQFAIVNAVRTVMHNCCRSQLASSVRIFPSDCLN